MRDYAASARSASEIECPTCGTVVVNGDFCSCGEYVRWELTLASDDDAPAPPAPAAPEYRSPAPPVRQATLLTLRDPAREDDPGASVAISVMPGTDVTLVAKILMERGPERVTPACPVAEACGGCVLMALPYAEQLRHKGLLVAESSEAV